jgi:hypothetical protein
MNSQTVFLSRHFIRESHLGFGQIGKYFSWADVRVCVFLRGGGEIILEKGRLAFR